MPMVSACHDCNVAYGINCYASAATICTVDMSSVGKSLYHFSAISYTSTGAPEEIFYETRLL